MFCIILVKWEEDLISTKMKKTDASNSNNDQNVGGKVLPQTKADVTKVNLTDNNSRNIKQRGRKRVLENIAVKGVLTQEENTVQKDVAPKKQRKSEKRPDSSTRFDYSLGHFPHIDKSRAVRCKNNKCDKKTFVYCPICEVHLCCCIIENRNCFTDFHTDKK